MQYFQPTNLHAKLNLMSENIMVHLFASKNSAKIFRSVKMNTFNNGTKFPPPMINSLIWNIRGLPLRKLVRLHRLSLICVLEPFISVDRLEALRVRLGMDHALSSQSGKIWVFWSAPFSVELLHDMGKVIYYRVSHSFFPDPV